jgi:hypothetical protein
MMVSAHLGHQKPGFERRERPTLLDIAWAAGIYEGEGHCTQDAIQIGQNDPWLLYRLQALFGGRVAPTGEQRGKPFVHYRWSASGPRGRGFAMTIYKFLSPRRQAQIRDGVLRARVPVKAGRHVND